MGVEPWDLGRGEIARERARAAGERARRAGERAQRAAERLARLTRWRPAATIEDRPAGGEPALPKTTTRLREFARADERDRDDTRTS